MEHPVLDIPAVVIGETQFHAVISGFPSRPRDRVRGQLVIHDPFETPGSRANSRRRQTILLNINSEDRKLRWGKLSCKNINGGKFKMHSKVIALKYVAKVFT